MSFKDYLNINEGASLEDMDAFLSSYENKLFKKFKFISYRFKEHNGMKRNIVIGDFKKIKGIPSIDIEVSRNEFIISQSSSDFTEKSIKQYINILTELSKYYKEIEKFYFDYENMKYG